MIRILSAAISLEGMPNANGLLTIPGGVVQARRRQDGARRHRRQVHVGIRVVLHRRRVRETRGTRTSVAGTRASMTLTRARIFRNRTRDYRCRRMSQIACDVLCNLICDINARRFLCAIARKVLVMRRVQSWCKKCFRGEANCDSL